MTPVQVLTPDVSITMKYIITQTTTINIPVVCNLTDRLYNKVTYTESSRYQIKLEKLLCIHVVQDWTPLEQLEHP